MRDCNFSQQSKMFHLSSLLPCDQYGTNFFMPNMPEYTAAFCCRFCIHHLQLTCIDVVATKRSCGFCHVLAIWILSLIKSRFLLIGLSSIDEDFSAILYFIFTLSQGFLDADSLLRWRSVCYDDVVVSVYVLQLKSLMYDFRAWIHMI